MLRIFLISLIIIGCFSNFAHNDWGFQLRAIAELILGITFLVDFVYGIIKKDLQKTKSDRILMQIERFCIAIYFMAFFLKVLHWPGPGPMYALSILILVIVNIIRLLNLFFNGDYSKNQKRVFSLILFSSLILSTIYIYSLMGSPDDPTWLFVFLAFVFSFICCPILLLLLLRLSILIFKRNNISAQKFVCDLFLITTVLLSCGVLFKTMHWPMGGVFIFIGFCTFILTLILSLTTKTTIEGTRTKLFSLISSKFQYSRFMFLYFGIWSIYIMLAIFKIAPAFHSNQFPYVFEKLLEAEEREKADKILTNYEALVNEIDIKNASFK